MSWRCELTGKTRQIGHKVSHSNRKTKRRFLPNLLNVTLMSDSLGRSVRLRISANALKTRRPSRRARRLPAQGQGRRTLAARARTQAASRQEADRRRLTARPRAGGSASVALSQIFVEPVQRAPPGELGGSLVVAGRRVVVKAVIGAGIHIALVRNVRGGQRRVERRPS